MRVFWAAGYEGASISSLCRAMNIPKASLYQQFSDKEALFLAAVDHYGETRLSPIAAALGPRAGLGDDLRAFYETVADLATSVQEAPGCLISCVLSDAAGSNPVFRAELERRFVALEARLEARLTIDQDALPPGSDPKTLAAVLAATARGLMLRARAGADRDSLLNAGFAAVALICGDARD